MIEPCLMSDEAMEAIAQYRYPAPMVQRDINALLCHIYALQQGIQDDTFCAYCGKKYPKGTPKSQNELLTAHIKVCEKHPLRVAEWKNKALEEQVKTLRKALIDGIFAIGGSASENCTDGFICLLPEEIKAKLEDLREERDLVLLRCFQFPINWDWIEENHPKVFANFMSAGVDPKMIQEYEFLKANSNGPDLLTLSARVIELTEENRGLRQELNSIAEEEYPAPREKPKPPTKKELEEIDKERKRKAHLLSQTGPGTGVTVKATGKKKKIIDWELPIFDMGTPDQPLKCIRVRDIPDEKMREKFLEWMIGQTCPLKTRDDGTIDPNEIQDYCYVWDYKKFVDLERTGRKETAAEWD